VATLYGYDGLGRTVLVTETGILTGTFNPTTLQFSTATTRVTKTEYDTLSRPVTVTLDYGGANLQTIAQYDGAGNVIHQRDALGRWTYTDYDVISRPITVTLNYQDGKPLTGARDADIVTTTEYDAAGHIKQQTDNWVDGTFNATDRGN
jgi:YD repeat-containing protein